LPEPTDALDIGAAQRPTTRALRNAAFLSSGPSSIGEMALTLTSDSRTTVAVQRIPRTKSRSLSRKQMDHRPEGDLSNHPRCRSLTTRALRQGRRGRMLSSAQASGWRRPEEGDRFRGCHAASTARLRSSPPDSGVVPFSESLRRHLRATTASVAASNRRSEPASQSHHYPQSKPWGENDDPSDRACGIS